MKIQKDSYEGKVTRVFNEEGSVNVYDLPIDFDEEGNQLVTFKGINWSEFGTVTVEEAENYIELMKVAIEEAKKQNKE